MMAQGTMAMVNAMPTDYALEMPDTLMRSVSPFREMGAYEALWSEFKASFKWVADKFREHPGAVPSDFVPEDVAAEFARKTVDTLAAAGVAHFGIRVHGAGEYPMKLRVADHPVELLYFQGWWDLVESRGVAVVGTRQPSEQSIARTRKLVRCLVDDKFTVVSGLAKGIDTIAHLTTMEAGGRTIAVIGTPLSVRYPRENAELQDRLAKDFLVISQVPVVRYDRPNPTANRIFFPERNITMSALTEATIIVEAGETSGTLIQARHALKQKKKLFILESNFHNPALTWPHRFEQLGAIRVRDYEDIQEHLAVAPLQN